MSIASSGAVCKTLVWHRLRSSTGAVSAVPQATEAVSADRSVSGERRASGAAGRSTPTPGATPPVAVFRAVEQLADGRALIGLRACETTEEDRHAAADHHHDERSQLAALQPGSQGGTARVRLGDHRDRPQYRRDGGHEHPGPDPPGLDQLPSILQAGGASLDDVVEVGVLLSDPDDFAGMDQEYAQWFPTTRRRALRPSWEPRCRGCVSIRMTAVGCRSARHPLLAPRWRPWALLALRTGAARTASGAWSRCVDHVVGLDAATSAG